MIVRFRHKGLEALFFRGDARGVSARDLLRLRLILAALATSVRPEDMELPGASAAPVAR